MRWERFFEDLSGQADDQEKLERDALANDVREEQWAQTSWADMLVMSRSVHMAGAGEFSGRIDAVGPVMFHLTTATNEHLMHMSGVRALIAGPSHRRDALPQCRHRPTLRQWMRDSSPVRVVSFAGDVRSGSIERVGQDFVLVASGTRSVVVPIDTISVISRSC